MARRLHLHKGLARETDNHKEAGIGARIPALAPSSASIGRVVHLVSRLDERRAEEHTSSLDDGRIVRRGLWLTFESSALEAEYWLEARALAGTLTTAYVSTVLLGITVFSIDDYRLLGWTASFAQLAAVRLFLVIVSLAVLWRIRQQPSRRRLEWLILLWALVLVAGHGLIAAARPVDYLLSIVNGRAVVLLGFLMVPSPWAIMMPASLLLSALYSAFIVTGESAGAYQALVSSSWLFLTVNGLACVWAVQHEYANRRRFTALRSETRLRQELARAKRAADRSNLAKSEFLAMMSHEIRTPMNGVLGFANLLSETPLTDEQKLYVSTIRGSGETLLAIINDVLDFSKIEAGQLVLERIPFDVRQTVQELIDLMSVRAGEKQLTLSLHVEDDVPYGLLGDPGRLRQVLLNLVGNALKFTEAGQVEVVVRRSADDASLRFAVTDTGIGLTPTEIGRLFHRFSQADASTTRRFGGTGLGLAICKQLVGLMDGTIGVESRKGEGSTFWFTVPAAPGDLVHATAQATAAGGPDVAAVPGVEGRAPRVLVAEDNATNQLLAHRLLTLLGCAVDVAANGREAVDLWSRLPYDVIVMDCQMPEMDGLAATAEIRRREHEANAAASTVRRPRVRIVACSAGVTVSERERCFSAGMDDFVAKPLSRDELRRALRGDAAATSGRTAA